MIAWSAADFENLAAPDAAMAMLEAAIAKAPARAALHVKLGNIHLDRFDFGRAAPAFETALRLDPSLTDARLRLARAWNTLGRHGEVLDLLSSVAEESVVGANICLHRGTAHAALDHPRDAEREFRAALKRDPHNRRACMNLSKVLRETGRYADLLVLCETLAAKGVHHAQLLLDWGRALALNGQEERARRLLFDVGKVKRVELPIAAGFDDISAFNEALADELLANPFRLSDFPQSEEANRGSSRVHHLMNGKRPQLIRALVAAIQHCVDARAAELTPSPGANEFDPWRAARPARAHIKPWGLLQRGGDYEAWHTHRGGWMSGVYYVRVPKSLSAGGEGRGCIEFGPPPAVAETMPDFIAPRRWPPVEGVLLMAPSHYHHRTIPTGADEYRISFAFDVVPDE